MKIKENIFKAYDIRGNYPEEINKETAFFIGSAYIQFLRKDKDQEFNPTIVLGRDARPSSPKIFSGLASGIKKAGGKLVDIGNCSTPMLYFAVNYLDAEGGIMITASHNPAGNNGMKITREKAIPISGQSGLKEIKKKAIELASEESARIDTFETQKRDIQADYVDFFIEAKEINLNSPIALDFGNGMAGPLAKRALDKLGVPYKGLYLEPDCRFPNHEANPLKKETLGSIKEELQSSDYLFGAAFDGDGDRVGFLTEAGKMVGGDFVTALLARRILKNKEGGKVVYDLRSSKIVPETVEKAGGEAIETRVGHSFIKGLMREKEADFAGELSSHFYFPFQFEDKTAYFESSILALLEILELVSETGKTLSELVAPLQKYYQSGEVNFKIEKKEEVMKELEEHYNNDAERISHLDGIKLVFGDWWFNLRPSNTEPYLRLNLEAKTEKLMKEKLQEVEGLIQEYEKNNS